MELITVTDESAHKGYHFCFSNGKIEEIVIYFDHGDYSLLTELCYILKRNTSNMGQDEMFLSINEFKSVLPVIFKDKRFIDYDKLLKELSNDKEYLEIAKKVISEEIDSMSTRIRYMQEALDKNNC